MRWLWMEAFSPRWEDNPFAGGTAHAGLRLRVTREGIVAANMETINPGDNPAEKTGLSQGLTLIAVAWLIPLTLSVLTPVLPAMARYFANTENADFLIGIVATAPALAAAFFAPLMGWLSDRLGARRVLITSLLIYIALGTLPFWVSRLETILALRVLLGIALTGAVVASTALIARYFEGPQRIRWLGLQSASANLAGIGVGIIGGIVGTLGWRAPFLIYLAPALLLVTAFVFLHRDPCRGLPDTSADSQEGGLSTVVSRALIANYLMTILASVILLSAVLQISFLFTVRGFVDPRIIGLGVSLATVGAALGSFAVARLQHLSGCRRLALSFTIAGIGLVMMALATDFWMTTGGGFVAAVGGGLAYPTLVGLAVAEAQPLARGRVSGAWMASMFFGQFINPPIFALANTVSGGVAHSVLALAVFCVMVAAVLLVRDRARP
jgi:MFS family permease